MTALITGASKRVGRAIANYLAEKGWNVIIHYNTSALLAEEFITELSKKFKNQVFGSVKADLSDFNAVEKLIPDVTEKFGQIDLLINNASVFDPGYIAKTTPELLNDQIDINFKAPFLLTRDYRNYCQKGNIINITDTRISSNKSDFAAYSLSKKLLWELTKMSALEFAPDIRVNAIAPGAILAPENKDDEYLMKVAQNTPMKKPGGIDSIIKSLDFILNNDNMTGQSIFADGGEQLGQNV